MKAEKERREYDMKCPMCARYSLRDVDRIVRCTICGYALTPGQSDKFRLFQLLKREQEKA